jgi:hypothetical protein
LICAITVKGGDGGPTTFRHIGKLNYSSDHYAQPCFVITYMHSGYALYATLHYPVGEGSLADI